MGDSFVALLIAKLPVDRGGPSGLDEERPMTKNLLKAVLFMVALLFVSFLALAQEGEQQSAAQRHPMTFFVTSVGIGNGANLAGLAGADAHCLMLATAVGAGNHIWHAYLSTQAKEGQPAINARDRIGQGPWFNSRGQQIAMGQADLHGDTLELARLGSNLFKQSALNEKGQVMNGVGDTPNTHDMLTGSQTDGRAYADNQDHTCSNWTSSGTGSAQVGHSDRIGGGNRSWNSAHASKGCSQDNLVSTGGAGLFYCFAIN
jgi:hypothetical protein